MDREIVKEKMPGWESEEREVRHRERQAEIETDWGIEKKSVMAAVRLKIRGN